MQQLFRNPGTYVTARVCHIRQSSVQIQHEKHF